MQYTGDPITINDSLTLKYATFDGDGNLRETIKSEDFIIDTESPDAVIIAPLDNTLVEEQQPTISVSATDTGGADVFTVQVQVNDITDPQNEVLITSSLWLSASYNSNTGQWDLVLDNNNITQPLAPEHRYRIDARAFDAVGNASPIVSSEFVHYVGALAYMTLDITPTKSSIIQNDILDVQFKLTQPGDLYADLDGSVLQLEILAPDDTLTVIDNITTDALGRFSLTGLGDGSDITFNQTGTYYLQAHYNWDGSVLTRQPADSAIKPLQVGESAGYAVIIQGKLPTTNPDDFASHTKTASRVYQTLIDRNLQPENIDFFSFDTDQDFDLDGADGDIFSGGVDAVPTWAGIQSSIQGMYNRINQNSAPFYLIMVDHADQAVESPPSESKFHIDNEVILPSDIDDWLDSLEGNLADQTQPRLAIIGSCYSGAYLDEVSDTALAIKRVVISSAYKTEVSYKGTREPDDIRVGEYFMEALLKQMGRGDNVKLAFEKATDATETFTRRDDTSGPMAPFNDEAVQHPHLDDDGNGVGSNDLNFGTDGALAETVVLGVGIDYGSYIANVSGDIAAVTDTISLPAGTDPADTSAFLTLTANDNAKVSAAWVEVRAPAITYIETGAATEQAQIEPDQLDKRALTATPGDWLMNYTDFNNAGRYEVFYFVRDTLTSAVSPAQRSFVYKNKGGNDYATTLQPTTFNLLSPAHEATTASVLMFDWENSNDDNGLTYTLEIAAEQDPPADVDPPDGGAYECSFASADIVHRQEELAVSHALVGLSANLQDGQYCWRVLAIDSYGTTTVSSPAYRVFTADTKNGYLGFVSGTVRDSVSRVGLDGVVVTPSGGTVVDYSEDNGSYLIAVDPAATYTFTASVAGYADGNISAAASVQVNTGEDILLTSNSLDTDGDGTPDVTDTDDDNDGISDVDEIEAGSDPLDNTSWPHYADGDLNADGNVNAGDYLIAMRISLNLMTATPVHLAHGDMVPATPDGVINTPDVLLVLKLVMGM
jgi:hypothetical protein